MHFPSRRIYEQLQSTSSGIWFTPANDGKEIAILLKTTTSIIKSITFGSKINFVFGDIQNILCCGVTIFDIPENPAFIYSAILHTEEHVSLNKFLNSLTAPLFIFNELDVCVAWCDIKIDNNQEITSLADNIKNKYVGDFTDACSTSLDNFFKSVFSTQFPACSDIFKTISINVDCPFWEINQIDFIGNFDVKTLVINESDEGSTLEKSIWSSLESVFPFSLYHSPLVRIGKKDRELTDILTFHEYGSFLFEAKDFSVLNRNTNPTLERRATLIKKQSKKAISQLIGASKAIKRGEMVFSKSGERIPLITDKPLHCIVLITEFPHNGDWSDIKSKLFSAMSDTGDFFHILDLQELIVLLKCSSGDAKLLDYNLMERCKAIIEHDSLYMRCRPAQ